MNEQLINFARNELKEGLAQLTDANRLLFKRMYSHNNLDLPINEVVDKMPEDKLDWAMQQVSRTLKKKTVNINAVALLGRSWELLGDIQQVYRQRQSSTACYNKALNFIFEEGHIQAIREKQKQLANQKTIQKI